MERKSLAGFCFFLIVLLAAQEMVVKTEACEKPSALFTGACVGTSGNQQCDYLCRRGENLLSGTCKNQKCVCAC